MTVGAALAAALAVTLSFSSPVHASQGASQGTGQGSSSTRLSYDVFAGGLKAMRADLAVDLREEDYRLQLDARFQGFIAKLFSLDLTVVAEGKLERGSLEPLAYDLHSVWQETKERRIKMAFEEGAALEVAFEPEDQEPPAPELVPLAERKGAMDPITALLWPISELLSHGSCDGENKVFDGKKLFRLELEPRGSEVLRPTGYSPFSGETLVCRLHIEQIAGKMKDKSKNRIPPFVDVFLAPIEEGGPPLPIRLEATNLLGRIVLHLTEASGGFRREQLTLRPLE
jgi:hypothetical protein